MRILHVAPTYFPAVRYGGPIYSTHGLCKALAARGHDVHVFTTNVDGDGVSAVPLDAIAMLDGVKVRYFPAGFGRRLYRSPQMGAALENEIASFSIVHTHSVFLWPPAVAARKARRKGVATVVSPRGMLVADLIQARSRAVKTAWINMVDRANVENADVVHVTSPVERREIENLGLTTRAFATIPNGIDLPAEKQRVAHAAPFVLCLGRLNWKKGLDRLILAMRNVPQARLVIAGNDEENYTAQLRAIAEAARVLDRVQFVGHVEGESKFQLMRDCAVFALASRSENFGNVALEAMACGAPLVLTPEVGFAAEAEQAGAAVVVAGDPEPFGVAIARVLASPGMRERMRTAGMAAARSYSWADIAARMERVYESVA
ncbi:MAG: glycosyltransferase, partial [Hyphomicrobiales bacterium]|nr:glycosyltransferase [Hyphomicrobiales bacterium]